jgi:glutathione peroxidase-family protein
MTEKATNPEFSGKNGLNFDKLLIDRSGKIIAHFDPSEKREDEKIANKMEEALKQN